MIGRTLFSTAALSIATQLSTVRQFADNGALAALNPPNGNGAPAPASLLKILGRATCEQGGAIIRREIRFGVVPELELSLRIIANATPVSPLTLPEALLEWERISKEPDDLWVDIGSGNGETLGRLARRYAGRFTGVDMENSMPLNLEVLQGTGVLNEPPPNVRYLVLSYNRPGSCPIRHGRLEPVPMGPWFDRPSYPDTVMDATVDTIGAGSAAAVSLFFPYTESSKRTALDRVILGPVAESLDYQLMTAVRLLRPGGLGVAVLEAGPAADQKRVLERALRALRTRPELQWIRFTPAGFDVETLGIAPYAPKNKQGWAVDTEALHRGRLVFFRRKA